MTPDYHFKRVLDPERAAFSEAIVNQMKENQFKREYESKMTRERDILEHN